MQTQEKTSLFKEVMGNYPTGVTIVTTKNKKGIPVGLTVNSFASLSLDPMLILWSIDHGASSLEDFKGTEGFAVHVLAGDQSELCKDFARKDVDNAYRFEKHGWRVSEHNLPILKGFFGVLQCKLYQQVEAGDHTIMIGEVKDIQIENKKEPMLYHRRQFGSIPAEFYTK